MNLPAFGRAQLLVLSAAQVNTGIVRLGIFVQLQTSSAAGMTGPFYAQLPA